MHKKYTIIHMVAVGSGNFRSYIPECVRVTTGNFHAFIKNNPYYDDLQFVFEGHPKDLLEVI